MSDEMRHNQRLTKTFRSGAAIVACVFITAAVALGVNWRIRTKEMVRIPGGVFTMGCDDTNGPCWRQEKPTHRVTLRSFWMDRHPTTVAEYAQCVHAGICKKPNCFGEKFCNWGKIGRADHPMNVVNWNDATAFCRWKGKRLPTEAEYEYALRGDLDGVKYPWGNGDTPPVGFANYADESFERRFGSSFDLFVGYDDGYAGTSPVCAFSRNRYGLCDLSGNVNEWCADWYETDYYSWSPSYEPRGPSEGKSRVQRGASGEEGRQLARVSARGFGVPSGFSRWTGFRCVRD